MTGMESVEKERQDVQRVEKSVLEDIHAAGRRTLERLARLISSAGEASVLLFMTSAYGGEGREKAWQGAMVNAPLTTIDLQ